LSAISLSPGNSKSLPAYLGTFSTYGNLSSATENPVRLNRREIGLDVGGAKKIRFL